MNEFKTVEEFNGAWDYFVKKEKRQRWHMPPCSYWEQKGMPYTRTARFRWIVETFRLWEEYKRDVFKK